MRRGKQRRIYASGVSPAKRHEVATVDWRTGDIVRVRCKQRNASAFCHLVEKCLKRLAEHKKTVIMVLDRARFHRPDKSKLMKALVDRHGSRLTLRYVPSYSPDCMPMELLWNDWRDNVTHNHGRRGYRAGYNGAKRRKGSKAHIPAYTKGRLLAPYVTATDGQDRRLVGGLSRQIPRVTGATLQLADVDQGYSGHKAGQVAGLHFAAFAIIMFKRVAKIVTSKFLKKGPVHALGICQRSPA